MIRVAYLPNPFDASSVELELVAWRDGLTVDDAIPPRLTRRDALTVRLNGEPAELGDAVPDGAALTVAAMPTDPLTGTLLGSALNSLSTWWAAQHWGVQLAIGLAGANIASRLLAPSPSGRRRGDEESPTYGFSGPGNIRVEGQPIPIVYGRYRVAGTVLNEFVRTLSAPPQADYYALISFGEGPVNKIAGEAADTVRGQPIVTGGAFPTGIQINGIDAKELDDVAIAVRMGSIEQDVVSDDTLLFESTEQGAAIGSALPSVETSDESNATLAFDQTSYTAAAANTHFTDYGVAYSFTSEFDAFRALVNFTGGLFRLNSSGGSAQSTAVFALRYIELDGSGVPIASGGPDGDGYVRLPPQTFVAAQRSPFTLELSSTFYDPQTFSYPAGGRALVLDGSNDFARNTSPTIPTQWQTAGADVDAMSFTAWFQIPSIANLEKRVLWRWTDGSTRGIRVDYEQVFVGLGSGPGGGYLRLLVRIGNGSSITTYTQTATKSIVNQFGQWVQLGFSYAETSTGGTLSFIQNGAIRQTVACVAMKSPGSGTDFEIGQGVGGVGFLQGSVDEFEWRSSSLAAGQISERWAGGQGKFLTADTQTVGLWHFDTTGSSTAADSSSFANTLSLVNGANVPSAINGKVFAAAPSSATPKRGRYKVELVRVNEDSTAVTVQDDAVFSEVYGVTFEEYSYPRTPILALRVRASEQINSAKPTVTTLVEGRLCKIWDGISQTTPDFYEAWTRNPAWIALDLILSERYGMGSQYQAKDVDLASVQALAEYADEKVYDHQGQLEATADWTDAVYTGTSGVGTITFEFTAGGYAKIRWTVGDSIGVSGAPVVSENINSADLEGYEITAMDSAARTVTVAVSLPGDPWTSGTDLSASATVTGTLEGREPRYTFDAVIDTARGAWEQLLDVLATARAVPVREGKRIRFKYEHPRSAVDIIGQASIVPESFVVSYGGRSSRPNSLTVEFHDEDLNYDRVSSLLDHPSIQGVTTLDKVRTDSIFLFGVTRRSQAMRHAAFLLNTNDLLVREGRFECSVEALAWEVGDVVIVAHDVMPWGDSGRIYETDTSSSIKPGTTVTLAAATTYELVVRNSLTGAYESRTVSSAAGTYDLGDAITVSSAFSFAPQRDDVYVLCVQGEERRVQITEITTTPELRRAVTWVEYDADVYDDDWFEDIDAVAATSSAPFAASSLPLQAQNVTAEESASRGPGGNYRPSLQVSWEHADGAQFVARTEVYASLDGGPFEHVATADGNRTSVDVVLPNSVAGQSVVVAVQPVSASGARRSPAACTSAGVTITGRSRAPAAPTSVSATMNGELCEYVVARDDLSHAVELRRGGWILGDRIATIPPGRLSTGPIASWASRFQATDPVIYARCLNSAGQYSDAATLAASLSPSGARTVPSWITAGNINWAVYADGWRTISAPPSSDPVITGFTVNDDALGDYLTFDGLSLTATYEAGYAAPSFDLVTASKVTRCYVESWYEAEQSYPYTAEQLEWAAGDPLETRWTAEGPLSTVPGEALCTLKIQVDYHDGTDWSGWQDLSSGSVFSLTDIKFRLIATRPSTSHNVRIKRFVTRVRTQAAVNNERTPAKSALRASIFGG